MTDTASLLFVPVCPFAWKTSKWVRMVAVQRDYRRRLTVHLTPMINSEIAHNSHFPAEYEEGHISGRGCCGPSAVPSVGRWSCC